MKVALVVLATLAGCLALAKLVESKEKEVYTYEHRPHLGHFRERPFMDLYKSYAMSFIVPLHKDRNHDDYRYVVPDGIECVNYFTRFRNTEYTVRNFEEFIILDACLGYVFDSTYHKQDSESEEVIEKNLPGLKEDKQLKDLYEGAQVENLPEEGKNCIQRLLYNSVLLKKQYPDRVCNNHWLQLFIQFAECHETIPADQRESDTYLRRLYELLKLRGTQCFEEEVTNMNAAVHTDYQNNPFAKLSDNLLSNFKSKRRQAYEREYPKSIVKLLSIIQNDGKQINLRHIHKLIRGTQTGDLKLKATLLNNVSEYANKVLKKSNEATVAKDYKEKVVDDLCLFFRRTNRENYYDYATPFIRMVRLVNYPEVFGVSLEHFRHRVIVQNNRIVPMYFSVSVCNLLTFTEAFASRNDRGKNIYQVAFVDNTKDMVQWPDAGFY